MTHIQRLSCATVLSSDSPRGYINVESCTGDATVDPQRQFEHDQGRRYFRVELSDSCLLGSHATKPYNVAGSIRFPVAQAFLRARHIVYGQTSSESTVKHLATEKSTCATLQYSSELPVSQQSCPSSANSQIPADQC